MEDKDLEKSAKEKTENMDENSEKVNEDLTKENQNLDENIDEIVDELKEEINEKKEEVKEEQKNELDIANDKIKDLEDRYKRLLAEFDNFRKRSEKESASMYDIGASSALTKILPIVDNIERALNNVPEDLKNNAFVEGVDKTYKQIQKTFEDMQIKPIEAVGKQFDANLHNAVMTDEESDAEVDTITEELQKGYTYKDQVLRYSMVKVKK